MAAALSPALRSRLGPLRNPKLTIAFYFVEEMGFASASDRFITTATIPMPLIKIIRQLPPLIVLEPFLDPPHDNPHLLAHLLLLRYICELDGLAPDMPREFTLTPHCERRLQELGLDPALLQPPNTVFQTITEHRTIVDGPLTLTIIVKGGL